MPYADKKWTEKQFKNFANKVNENFVNKKDENVQANFLTSDGFGNLRYYNGRFQYYDVGTSTWVDTNATPDNVYIMNMSPQPMKNMSGIYDVESSKYKLLFDEPEDTIIDGQSTCVVEKVIIRRKLGSVPLDENDGTLVTEVERKDFGKHKNNYFIDNSLSPNVGDIYYYKAFPMSTTGFYSMSTMNETNGILAKEYDLFGFKIDQSESDPANMITYIEDNIDFIPAHMDYENDRFEYGNWKDVWFIRNLKPCMLKYDGTVDYELYKNDYNKKLDGTDSDISNVEYEGNVMIGIPKVYWKIVDNEDDTANFYISNKKVDDDFHCWSHIDNNGNEIDYCYMSAYNGSIVEEKLRSLSGKLPSISTTVNEEIDCAKNNNLNSDEFWYIGTFSDRVLINILLMLIGKSTDTQTIFGTGNCYTFSSFSSTGVKNSGTMDNKGLFWGSQDNSSGVKVFGIEHWWANNSKRIAGLVNNTGTIKYKLTFGQSDCSTIDGYNVNGDGYITFNGSILPSTEGYISKMAFCNNIILPTSIDSGSASTYYGDYTWNNNSQVSYALVGGETYRRLGSGAFLLSLSSTSDYTEPLIGGSMISCKPFSNGGIS